MNVSLPPLIMVTDPGEDVDDTFAFMLAATSKKFALKAVISANEDLTPEGIGQIACYARKLLDAMGRTDVPVYQGESLDNHAFLCKINDLQKQSDQYLPAVEEIAKSSPKVYLLGIAALTSLAKITKAPWFDPQKFEIYLMGGRIESGAIEKAEYNIKMDYQAAQAVFQSGAHIHMVTCNTTFQSPLQLRQENKAYQAFATQDKPVFQLLKGNYQAFLDNYFVKCGYIPFLSDALTFSALEENFVTFSERKIEVLEGGRTVESDKGAIVQVSNNAVEFEKFIAYLVERMSQLQ